MAVIPQVNESQAREIRRRRREFIRVHHPDLGGDTDLFVTGLHTLDTGRDQDPGPLPRVVVVRRHPWLVWLAIAAARRLRYGPRPARVH